ncbi:MAG: hypothetical protein JSW47_03730 [Phycisphaerales bacterium]|nr:MAG: hypothetical protein JSW47_03730 [Phycisphaerales bacterium]
MNKFLTTWALAAVILSATRTADATPTLFGRCGITDFPDWVDSVTRSGIASSPLWISPDGGAAVQSDFPGWEKALWSICVSNRNYFNGLLTDFADSYSFDSPPASFTNGFRSGISRLPQDTGQAIVWNFFQGDDRVDRQLRRTSLIVGSHNASNYTSAWENIWILEDAEYVGTFAEGDGVELIFPVSAILLAGIAAGFVGRLGARRMLQPPNMSDM